MGVVSAARVAEEMLWTFMSLRFGLMMGLVAGYRRRKMIFDWEIWWLAGRRVVRRGDTIRLRQDGAGRVFREDKVAQSTAGCAAESDCVDESGAYDGMESWRIRILQGKTRASRAKMVGRS